MPYKDKDAARACWRRRNATPKRKAYMSAYGKEYRQEPDNRERTKDAQKRHRSKPAVKAKNAVYVAGRRANGLVHDTRNYTEKRHYEQIAGRPKPSVCECCGRTATGRKDIHFDHCHQKGHFRGWICRGCNVALGCVNDDVRILRKLIAYLERTKNGTGAQLVISGI